MRGSTLGRLAFTGLLLSAIFVPIAFNLSAEEQFLSVKYTLFYLLAGLSFLFLLLSDRGIGRLTPGLYPMVLFTAAAVFSLALSGAPATGLPELIKLFYGLLLIITICSFQEKKEVFTLAMIFSSVIICGYALFQLAGLDFIRWERRLISSTLGNPNLVAHILSGTAVLPLYFVLKPGGRYKKGLFALLFLLQALTLFATRCRGGLLGVAVSLFIFFFILRKDPGARKYAPAAAGLFLAAFLAFLPTGVKMLSSIPSLRENSNVFRLLSWQSTLNIMRDNPFFGSGPGTFTLLYPSWRNYLEWRISGGRSVTIEAAHNDYLQFGQELGIAGSGLFLLVIASAFSLAKRAYGRLGGDGRKLLAASTAGFSGVLVHMITNFNFRTPAGFYLFCFLYALMMTAASGRELPLVRFPRRLKYAAAALAAILILFSIYPFVSDIYAKRAYAAYYRGGASFDEAGDYFQKAAGLDRTSYRIYEYGGHIALEKNDAGKSKRLYGEALGKNPWSSIAVNNLAVIEGQKNALASVVMLKKSIELNPYYNEPYLSIFRKLLASGDAVKAGAVLELLNYRLPDSRADQMLAGNYFASAGNYEEALRFFKKALLSDIYKFDAVIACGKLYYNSGRLKEGRTFLEKYMNLYGGQTGYSELLSRFGNAPGAVR